MIVVERRLCMEGNALHDKLEKRLSEVTTYSGNGPYTRAVQAYFKHLHHGYYGEPCPFCSRRVVTS